MTKINSNASSLIDEYITNKPTFSKVICELLRELIHKSDDFIIEDWKWNIPVFRKNSMVCAFACFKKHVSISFFNGALMTDRHALFTGDCSAKNMRTIKFTTITEINENHLIDYFREAFLLSESPIKKVVTKTAFEIPAILQNALNSNKLAKENYTNMAYTYRKEYALYVDQAKRETTKLKRLTKVISNLEHNIKMHESYNC